MLHLNDEIIAAADITTRILNKYKHVLSLALTADVVNRKTSDQIIKDDDIFKEAYGTVAK